jgi:hypothetical protein
LYIIFFFFDGGGIHSRTMALLGTDNPVEHLGRRRRTALSFLLFLPVLASVLLPPTRPAPPGPVLDRGLPPSLPPGRIVPLDSPHVRWTAASPPLSLPATVPGDLLTDLWRAGLVGDPYHGTNFRRDAELWSGRTWTYGTSFALPPSMAGEGRGEAEALLVLEGVKMGARIAVDGRPVGAATDQFLRHVYPLALGVDPDLSGSGGERANHTLTVQFDPAMATDGNRFMACSGGWDWAPFPDAPLTPDPAPARRHTLGIWRSAYLVLLRGDGGGGNRDGRTAPESTPAAPPVAPAVALTAVVPEVFYRGGDSDYPTSPLRDGSHNGFVVYVTVRLWSPCPVNGTVRVWGSWGRDAAEAEAVAEVSVDGEASHTLAIQAAAGEVRLWWPRGTGPDPAGRRHLYHVHASFVPGGSGVGVGVGAAPDRGGMAKRGGAGSLGARTVAVGAASRRIGFRHVALVTGNDTDPGYVRSSIGAEGTGSHGMYLRVNGMAMWARGSNVVPMDELEGMWNDGAHRRMVRSAAMANMNLLRVWGGGAVLPPAFYDECDEMGIILYHDMMYAAQGNHDPAETSVQEAELRHTVRSLAHHPSIVLWDGCNECAVDMDGPTAIYATFVLRVVSEEDRSRAVWPSSPALGWEAGVDRLTARPTGGDLIAHRPGSRGRRQIEVHGPYVRGGGFPAVNGADDPGPIDPLLPLELRASDLERVGLGRPSVFASEFGCVAMSSFESMSATLDPDHWGLHGGAPPDRCGGGFDRVCNGTNVMAQRNYPCDNLIQAYFVTEDGYFDAVGEAAFQRQLYHCMMGQALQMKSTIEARRSRNEYGHLLWQLNEIWPTGGWGSLEHGTPGRPGQVPGGRWKPLHHLLRSGLFADVLATCAGRTGLCYVRNDAAARPFSGTVLLRSIDLATGRVDWSRRVPTGVLPPGPGSVLAFSIPPAAAGTALDGATHFLRIEVLGGADGDGEEDGKEEMAAGTGTLVSRNDLLLRPPGELQGLPRDSGLRARVGRPFPTPGTGIGPAGRATAVPIEVSAAAPVALYVVLTTQAPGWFSDNAFSIVAGGTKGQATTVLFHPFGEEVDLDLLTRTLRVEDVAMYQHPRTGEGLTNSSSSSPEDATEREARLDPQ